MKYCYFDSPLGNLLLAGTVEHLCLISFPIGKMARQPEADWQLDANNFIRVKQQLSEFFAGYRQHFDLNYLLTGTSFQQLVLRSVAKIPYGTTCSYSAIGEQINNPKAVRAIGLANGANPLPIIIPCHRVIGKNGSLTGFGGGLPAKKFLLDLEASGYITYNLCHGWD